MTGRRPSQNGYSKTHPVLLDFNPTLAGVLKQAGYATAAVVDNPNVAAQHGYAKRLRALPRDLGGGGARRPRWTAPAPSPRTAIALPARGARGPALLPLAALREPARALHAAARPSTRAFLDGAARRARACPRSPASTAGSRSNGRCRARRLGYYVAQYDGEIAAVDAGGRARARRAGRVAGGADRTVVVLTSDHGESLGEHDYYFDHGEDLFDPCLAIPLIVAMPGAPGGRRASELASTLDLVPTVLDAVKVSYPPDLGGHEPAARGRRGERRPGRERLFAQNDRNLSATWDARFKLVATPRDGRAGDSPSTIGSATPARRATSSPRAARGLPRGARGSWSCFLDRANREWAQTRRSRVGQEAASSRRRRPRPARSSGAGLRRRACP